MDFLDNQMAQDAVIRNIEIIGEAANNIEKHYPEFAAAHPGLPLSSAYQMRNAIAHGNYRIDEDGRVLVNGRTLTEDDCNRKYQDIRTFVYEFWVGMNKFFVENYNVAFE